ncbi:MAG: PAS domain S-box protein [Mariprofundaceae bacterium]|nr:PAS domain S-box protein [Mariprofundaceae bacterium]
MTKLDPGLPDFECRYRKIIEMVPDIMLVLDVDGAMLDLNPAAERLYGCLKADVLGKNYYELFLPEDERETVRQDVRKVLAGNPTHGYENPVISADGKEMCVRWNVDRLLDEQGTPVGVIATGEDITERKEVEDELRAQTLAAETSRKAMLYMLEDLTESHQAIAKGADQLRKLSACVEQSGEAILITDRAGTIEYVNPSFTKLTGYTSEEVMGKNPSILKSGNQDSAFYGRMWKTITAGKTWQGKVIDRRKDGSFYPALLTISPTHDQSDNTVGFTHFVGIQSDLTQIEDAEERFQQAQKMEAIGTLVGGIAHDFNNMLAGMTGNLFLAKKQAKAMPQVVHRLDIVESLAYRAADMIVQLLAFARKSAVEMKAIPLTTYIKEVLKLLSVSVPENIQLNRHICSDDLQVYGDSTQIHQILMNLITNARDALADVDDPTITITLAPFTASGSFVKQRPYAISGTAFAHLSVSDNGCGIPEHQINHLFEPFFTTKEQGKGTGLGLAMVYGAVKGHNGFIEVESEQGKGTNFHLYLPLMKAQAIGEVGQAEEIVEGKGECILLVDDEKTVLDTGRDVLRSLGYKVLTATNGVEAVELFKSRPDSIDLVILDLVMPKLGGVEACRRMREIRAEIKVMFATGYDKEQSLDKGIIDVEVKILKKPFTINKMSAAIQRILDC